MPTATALQLLPFTSSIPCPVKLVWCAGEGRWGFCGMELMSVILKEFSRDGKPWDKPASIDLHLRSAVIRVNDLMDSVDSTKRADDLWPILPALIGTAEAAKYLPASAMTCDCCEPQPMYPYETLDEALGVTSPYSSVSEAIFRYAKNDGDKDWDKAIHGLKVAISIFWDEVKKGYMETDRTTMTPWPTPREDFTPDQMSNLNSWLSDLKNGIIFPDEIDGEHYDSSKTLREAA